MSIDFSDGPLPHLPDRCDATGDGVETEARKALEMLMLEARKLVVEMRRLLREQCQL
jgi:hypothetical protein